MPQPRSAPRSAPARALFALLLALLMVLSVGAGACSRSHLTEGFDGSFGADACIPTRTDDVDLLLVIDNSSSMGEEQEAFLRELPRIVDSLATGRLGGREFPPIASLQIGVISTDMGAFGLEVPTCGRGERGDDGLLIASPREGGAGCRDLYPRFLSYTPGGAATAGEVAAEATCLAALGTDGCGFEQPLEAALKALSPASPRFPGVAEGYDPPLFAGRVVGHADGENQLSAARPFLREGSILAILLLGDEDDCSAADPELFDLRSPIYSELAPNLRCSAEEALHPIDRYLEGLLQLRRSPRRLVFGAITGVPPDLSEGPSGLDYARALADPRMTPRPDATASRLEPACAGEGGEATPARRVVTLARDLAERGAHVEVRSVCEANLRPAADALTLSIADALQSEACAYAP